MSYEEMVEKNRAILEPIFRQQRRLETIAENLFQGCCNEELTLDEFDDVIEKLREIVKDQVVISKKEEKVVISHRWCQNKQMPT